MVRQDQTDIITDQCWVTVKSASSGRKTVASNPKTAPASAKQPASKAVISVGHDPNIAALRAAYKMVSTSDALAGLKVMSTAAPLPVSNTFLGISSFTLPQPEQKKSNQILPKLNVSLPQPNKVELDGFAPKANVLMDWENADLEDRNEDTKTSKSRSFGIQFVGQHKWVWVMLAIGLCLLASMAYVGIGYWVLISNNPSHAAEPASVLQLDDTGLHKNLTEGLENLHKLQDESQGGIIVPDESHTESEAMNLMAIAQSPFDKLVPGLPEMKRELTGRSDPFAPLVQEPDPNNPMGTMEQPKDVLEALSFTGFIGETNAKEKVVILKMPDEEPTVQNPIKTIGESFIKKVGESFIAEGEKVVLKSIGKDFVVISAHGQSRRLGLMPYVDTTIKVVPGVTDTAKQIEPETLKKLEIELGKANQAKAQSMPQLMEPPGG